MAKRPGKKPNSKTPETIPAELRKYGEAVNKEDNFTQKFLLLLLQHLGFYEVENYHGVREHGKDLVFGELDRFGHIRYYGLQAKYMECVSKDESHGLIKDCSEAFTNPFEHRTSGTRRRICTFYVANAGTISDPARENFFNSFRHGCFEGNVWLLDGKSLVALDRGAAFRRAEMVGETLTGLCVEIRMNTEMIVRHLKVFQEYLKDPRNPMPLVRLRGAAMSNYLLRPVVPKEINVLEIANYLILVDSINRIIDFCVIEKSSPEIKQGHIRRVIDVSGNFLLSGIQLEKKFQFLLNELGPLTDL